MADDSDPALLTVLREIRDEIRRLADADEARVLLWRATTVGALTPPPPGEPAAVTRARNAQLAVGDALLDRMALRWRTAVAEAMRRQTQPAAQPPTDGAGGADPPDGQ